MKQLRCVMVGWIAVVACSGALLSVGCGGGGEQPTSPPGLRAVIVVAVDGLRADHLGPYGGEIPTPGFDALAAQSVRFSWCFAQAPDASVSFASMLAGLYPTTAGVVRPGDRLPDEAATLAEAFTGSGFQTVAFVEGTAGADDLGLAQGFEVFTTSPTPGPGFRSWISEHAGDSFLAVLHGWSVGLDPRAEAEGRTPPDGFAQRLQEVIASTWTEQPKALDEADLAYVEALYADRIRAVDRALETFLAELESAGLADSVALVVTGTAGLDLGAHGATGPLSVHSTITRVPLFIRIPGRAAQAVDKIVELVDVMPTLLELAGAEIPAGVQGASLMPLIDGSARPPYIAFSESPWLGGQQGVALGGLHLVTSFDGAEPGLYDLSVDPAELENIAGEYPDKVEVLERHLEAWGKMVAAASLDPELRTEEELDDATLEQLKSLGYIQ